MSNNRLSAVSATATRTISPAEYEAVSEAIAGIQFGSVNITLHEGRIVQIDVTEKRRLTVQRQGRHVAG
ncbi:MAG: YezD family protein [Novosphingobium sp.]